MFNNHQNVCAPTNLEQLRLTSCFILPTLYSETETPPSQLESLMDSVEIHFTDFTFLSELCFDYFIFLLYLSKGNENLIDSRIVVPGSS